MYNIDFQMVGGAFSVWLGSVAEPRGGRVACLMKLPGDKLLVRGRLFHSSVLRACGIACVKGKKGFYAIWLVVNRMVFLIGVSTDTS